MKRILMITSIYLLVVSCESKRKKVERAGEPDVLLVESQNNEMNVAIENARSTIKSDFH